MDFKQTVKAELEGKYVEMINTSTPAPYNKDPRVDNQQTYASNREKYYKRLQSEKIAFNNARRTITERRDARVKAENMAKAAKDNQKFRKGQAFRTFIFFLPVIIAILVGLDVFNKSHGHIAAIRDMETLNLGWIIFFYVVFCLVSLISAITFTAKMFSHETYTKYVSFGRRGYKKAAVTVAFLSIFIISLNLMHIVPNLNKSRVIFKGGDVNIIEYVEKGESMTLPRGIKEDVDHEVYKTRYTFEGWLIDGVFYRAGSTYTPNGWTTAEATFTEMDWCTLTVSTSHASVKIEYDGKTYEQSSSYEIPRGTEVTVHASFSYSNKSFYVGGSSVSNPYTFHINANTSVSASSSDPGCLVEGTMVTLADGTAKAVEDLQMGDVLLVFNHETGKYDYAPLFCNVHAKEEAEYYNVMNLSFSDGSALSIVKTHGLFDMDLNEYVHITEENAMDFVGHHFVSTKYQDGELVSEAVVLENVEIVKEYTRIFNPVSLWHVNVIANDMLTLSAETVNLFAYDEDMKYDTALMEEELQKYGVYTYDDFKDYISLEVFNSFPFKYYKVAVEKGLFTYEQLLGLIQLYNDEGSLK